MRLEYQVPCHQEPTQSTTSPEYHSGRTLSLRRSLELFIPTTDILRCGKGVRDQLRYVGALYVEVLDQSSLQLGYLKHGTFSCPVRWWRVSMKL